MVNLFLSEPNWNDIGDSDSAKGRISLLSKLESVIQSFLMSGGRSEARLWLCNTVAGISSVTCRHQCELFMDLLRSKPVKYSLASQLLEMIFDKRPQKVGSLISKKSHPTRISEWFSNFSVSGDGMEHGKGAKALSQFAFVNRDICWEELEWKGKHGQSPAVVATKPHYFLDLDVQRTVENFLENVPEFWSSSEFAESLKDGEILFIDRNFFLDYFIDLMYKENSRDVWEVITEFLMEESFSYLCQHLLITLEERDFCKFLEQLRGYLHPRMEHKDFSNSSFMFEIILSKCSDFGSFDQILLLDATLTKKRELRRLLCDEGGEEAEAETKDIVSQICAIPDHDNSLAAVIKGCFKLKTVEAFKWLVLQSWVFYYRFLEGCRTVESWESLFLKNGITFRRSNTYALLNDDGLSEESGSDLDHGVLKETKHKKKSRKKRRKLGRDNRYKNEFLDFDTTKDTFALQSDSGSLLLSTDGYSTSWSIVDLPEHLSQHCLSKWMRWILAKCVE
ncbi:hypothetical protein PanWU01x14_263860 [Parasponia andersonii]|uniref:Uncharacterized protein n=1 Tax=Parasponia andersonii TaxID=3476 RepID=A0A2P5B7Q9_PARAD|nr:hypothetical protein PanWU01x14_263860 [Parasponia andersonii]